MAPYVDMDMEMIINICLVDLESGQQQEVQIFGKNSTSGLRPFTPTALHTRT